MKKTNFMIAIITLIGLFSSPSALAEGGFTDTIVGMYDTAVSTVTQPWSILSSAVASAIGFFATLFAMGVGVYALMTFVLGFFQFLLGFMFGPIGLLLMPLDKGRVISSTVSMMLTGITIFAVAFTVLLVSLELFSKAAHALSEAAIRNGEGGAYKLTFAIATVIYSYIMYQIVQQSNSWGAALFGGVGFSLQGVVRGMGGVGRAAGGIANNSGGKAAEGAARGVAGGLGGARAGAKGQDGLKNMAKGAGAGMAKGSLHAMRGRGGELSKKAPGTGSGLRLSDSFKTGGQAATQSSKVSDKGKALLSTPSTQSTNSAASTSNNSSLKDRLNR